VRAAGRSSWGNQHYDCSEQIKHTNMTQSVYAAKMTKKSYCIMKSRKYNWERNKVGVNLTLDVRQCDLFIGGSSEMKPPPREVSHNTSENNASTHTDDTAPSVLVTPIEVPNMDMESLLSRKSNPFKLEHVARIIQEMTISPDITADQCQAIQELLGGYTNCFALSMKEVNVIPGAIHKLKIPDGAAFWTKIPPRSYNPNQHTFINTKVNEMLEARIIRSIHPSKVHFVAQMILAQKAHDGQRRSIEELKHIVNKQCLKHGLLNKFDIPPNLNQNQTPQPHKKYLLNGVCARILVGSTKSLRLRQFHREISIQSSSGYWDTSTYTSSTLQQDFMR
jgi:hypothetical protein